MLLLRNKKNYPKIIQLLLHINFSGDSHNFNLATLWHVCISAGHALPSLLTFGDDFGHSLFMVFRLKNSVLLILVSMALTVLVKHKNKQTFIS